MYRYIIIILVLSVYLNSLAQDIDYNPKQLAKDIEKCWKIDQLDLTELKLKDSNNMLQGKYYSLFSSESESHNYVYIGRVNSCRVGGCSISYEPDADFESEYFDYFILFNSSGIVDYVRVYNYQATHGHEVSSKGWLKQFSGYDGKSSLKVGKEIDAISGATISVYGITQDVEDKTRMLYSHLN